VKTTIDLPEEILVKAKVVAAEQRTTLRALVVRGLEHVTSGDEVAAKKDRKVLIRQLLGRMQSGNREPMVPLTREEIHER
jgi:hypothetical protein